MAELWIKEHVLFKFRQMLWMTLQKRWHRCTYPSAGLVLCTLMPEVGNIKPKIYRSDGYKIEFCFDLLRIDDILLYIHLLVRVGSESSAMTFWEGCYGQDTHWTRKRQTWLLDSLLSRDTVGKSSDVSAPEPPHPWNEVSVRPAPASEHTAARN